MSQIPFPSPRVEKWIDMQVETYFVLTTLMMELRNIPVVVITFCLTWQVISLTVIVYRPIATSLVPGDRYNVSAKVYVKQINE